MTQMLYRPQTDDIRYEGVELNKVIFSGLPLDAIVVVEEDVDAHLENGWFAHPNDMQEEAKNDDSKPRNRRKSKAS